MLIGSTSPQKRYVSFSLGQVGVAAGLISISAFFGALVLAYAYSIGAHPNYPRISIPQALEVSTALILASSATLEMARYSLRRARLGDYRNCMLTTSLLGVAFLVSQLFAWWKLAEQGVYLESNPHGSAFYVFTGAHGLHLLSGVLCLFYLLHRSRVLDPLVEQQLRRHRTTAAAVAIYWHFMDLLWLILMTLLWVWNG